MAMRIKLHIEVLEDFEEKYGAFLVARRNREEIPEVQWSNKEWAKRERELRMLAPRAEAAIVASGVEGYADLSSVILAFKDWVGFTADARDDDLQWEILNLLPSQIGGLRMRLEEAEEASREKGRRLRAAFADRRPRWRRLVDDPNPWVLGFVVAVAAGLVILAIWAAITA